MALEYKIQVEKQWPILKEKVIQAIKKNPFFHREYIFEGVHWYEFKTKKNKGKMADVGIVLEKDGLYISRYDFSKNPCFYLENIKAILENAGDYKIEEL